MGNEYGELTWDECRGQYSDAVLNELESQNDGQVEGIMGKVRQLKDVSAPVPARISTCANEWADDHSNRRRDPGLLGVGRENE